MQHGQPRSGERLQPRAKVRVFRTFTLGFDRERFSPIRAKENGPRISFAPLGLARIFLEPRVNVQKPCTFTLGCNLSPLRGWALTIVVRFWKLSEFPIDCRYGRRPTCRSDHRWI